MVSNLIVRSLQDILPERVCAGCSTTKAVTFSSVTGEGESWIYMDVTEGAYGGYGMDGLDAVDVSRQYEEQPNRGHRSSLPAAGWVYELR
jgi:hypothetical protein